MLLWVSATAFRSSSAWKISSARRWHSTAWSYSPSRRYWVPAALSRSAWRSGSLWRARDAIRTVVSCAVCTNVGTVRELAATAVPIKAEARWLPDAPVRTQNRYAPRALGSAGNRVFWQRGGTVATARLVNPPTRDTREQH